MKMRSKSASSRSMMHEHGIGHLFLNELVFFCHGMAYGTTLQIHLDVFIECTVHFFQ
uniref:Uncharacterized protein n=1 Tax=Arundo donax TaxID=35708 RepID=A0A0A8YN28_ARUDO